MDWNLAGGMILTGLAIVFLILAILIGVVTLVGKLTGSSVQVKTPAAAKPVLAPVPAVSAPAPVPTMQSGISGETIAVISAAVAAMMDNESPQKPYVITGIQRAREARPVWGFAGMQQNTRPF